MELNERKHNYFYKITNLVNGKYYYGIHSTNNTNDGYFGSGVGICKAIKKYSKENFIKEIIADYPTRKEASDHEIKVVTLELTRLKECYNYKVGGDPSISPTQLTGPNNPMYGKKHSEETKSKIGKSDGFKGRIHTEESKLKMSNNRKGIPSNKKGIPLSEDTKEKIRVSNTGKKRSEELKRKHSDMFSGENNPMYGKKHSNQAIEKIKNKRSLQIFSKECIEKKRINCPHSKPCHINAIYYISMKEVSRSLNITIGTVKYRLSSTLEKWSDWKYI